MANRKQFNIFVKARLSDEQWGYQSFGREQGGPPCMVACTCQTVPRATSCGIESVKLKEVRKWFEINKASNNINTTIVEYCKTESEICKPSLIKAYKNCSVGVRFKEKATRHIQ